MATLRQEILDLVEKVPGLTDREITNRLRGRGKPQQPINQVCRQLKGDGLLSRTTRADGLIGNYRTDKPVEQSGASRRSSPSASDPLSEDSLKRALDSWFKAHGWRTKIAQGQAPGIDVDAQRGSERWVVEVKGRGSRPEMRANYFIAVLGELLQRMDDPSAKYSIALPDLDQFHGLWDRLPDLAKQRAQVTALFIDERGAIKEGA